MAEQRVPMTFRDVFFDDPFFKSTWDDFEKARENMMKESRGMWKRFEEEDGDFSGENTRPRMSRSSEKSSKSSRMESSSRTYENRSSSNTGSSRKGEQEKSSSGRSSRNNNEGNSKRSDEGSNKRSGKESGSDWMVPPSWMFPKTLGDEAWRMKLDDNDSEVISVRENEDKLEVSLNTSKYKPSELQVNVGGGIISVEGKHEEKAEDGRVMVSRQFSRQYSLPEQAKPTKVVSNLSSDGVLVVTAPKDKPAITEEHRNVPIAV